MSKVVWPNYNETNVRAAAAKKQDTLGKDQFLSILVTQLRNQDPMQPLQDKEFIAQMAQFTSVEQLMNMSTELSLMRQNIGSASSLIGKTIEWNKYNEAGEVITEKGVVDSILSKEGVLYASVGAVDIALDYVTSISETKAGSGEGDGSSTDENEGETDSDSSNSTGGEEGAETP